MAKVVKKRTRWHVTHSITGQTLSTWRSKKQAQAEAVRVRRRNMRRR